MAKLEPEIRDALKDRLQDSCRCGASEGVAPEVIPAEITDPMEVAAIRRAAAGMWKDRTDLPDFTEMRREWDTRLERLFGDV
ncbi:MAG TPA: hypothetical protein VFR81_04835 [Longimicrobium sp.]|nr:hypothetical protein [Longimicrobium sp.]